ncbi:tctex1 domain-containing protein 1 [Falco rusticolus]|uniref:tctex1 domain-containing protein 1 n=1 Tax=Falco rusticolus TaxID=120794 RepID=UPI0018867586|nr:tctex1 domain-containing protein 1 [Falco rusticolus]
MAAAPPALGGSARPSRAPGAAGRRWPPAPASPQRRSGDAVGMQGPVAGRDPRSGPSERFPVAAVDGILKDVVGSYLREQPYEPARCRDMVEDMAEVIKTRLKDLMIPRYKIVVVTHIGQLNEQSMQIGSRCLWDPVSDTFSSYVFKNASLFALANVYAVYFE